MSWHQSSGWVYIHVCTFVLPPAGRTLSPCGHDVNRSELKQPWVHLWEAVIILICVITHLNVTFSVSAVNVICFLIRSWACELVDGPPPPAYHLWHKQYQTELRSLRGQSAEPADSPAQSFRRQLHRFCRVSIKSRTTAGSVPRCTWLVTFSCQRSRLSGSLLQMSQLRLQIKVFNPTFWCRPVRRRSLLVYWITDS